MFYDSQLSVIKMLVVWLGVLALTTSAYAGGVSTSVHLGECPCNGDRNATMIACPYPCPRTCNSPRNLKSCARACPEFGCECHPGYVLSPRGKCILPKDCPAKCPRNSIYKECPYPCQPTCDNPGGIRPCLRQCKEFGCECKPGYVVSPKGKCIRLNQCPAAKYCSNNETFAACNVECSSEFCPVDDSRAQVACAVAYPCPPGCVCKTNHRRLSPADKRCILASDCPPVKCTRPNEEWNSCILNSNSERCDEIGEVQKTHNIPIYCNPQCVCKQGFCRNDSDICIPTVDYNRCPHNAIYKKKPAACPGTCDNPSGIRPCSRAGLEYGCECKPGYVLSEGKCILLKECPAAKSCKRNETFAACKVECPNNYCPENDVRAIIACDPPYPCPPGCVCQANHRRLSQTDDRCILASDCPPLKCVRPNEEWSRCPSNCLAERCEDIGKNQTECNLPYSYCDPKCVCKPGYYRNGSDICVPSSNCREYKI